MITLFVFILHIYFNIDAITSIVAAYLKAYPLINVILGQEWARKKVISYLRLGLND